MYISVEVFKFPSTSNKSNDIFGFRKFDINEMRLKLYYTNHNCNCNCTNMI